MADRAQKNRKAFVYSQDIGQTQFNQILLIINTICIPIPIYDTLDLGPGRGILIVLVTPAPVINRPCYLITPGKQATNPLSASSFTRSLFLISTRHPIFLTQRTRLQQTTLWIASCHWAVLYLYHDKTLERLKCCCWHESRSWLTEEN